MKDERIKVIDLLRGLSCLGVLLYHVRVDLWVGWWQITSYPQEYSTFAKLMAWLSVPTPFLGFAILLFFLISGFCIHYPNTVPNANPCWKTYFIRRFWRIYPTYFIAILFTALISYYCKAIWNDQTWDPNKIFESPSITGGFLEHIRVLRGVISWFRAREMVIVPNYIPNSVNNSGPY